MVVLVTNMHNQRNSSTLLCLCERLRFLRQMHIVRVKIMNLLGDIQGVAAIELCLPWKKIDTISGSCVSHISMKNGRKQEEL